MKNKKLKKDVMVKDIKRAMGMKTFKNRTVTLGMVLSFLQQKFYLKHLTERELKIVAAWRYDRDDLEKQYRATVRFIHYLATIPFPRTEAIKNNKT